MKSFWRPAALAIVCAASAAIHASAQSNITIQPVGDGLYVIAGAGGNIGVRVTENGVVLVDSGLTGRFADVERLVASVTPQPIRYVINTHFHPDHTGGNASVAEGVEVVAHSVTRDVMQRNEMGGAPDAVFSDGTIVRLGDVEVRALHLGAGHTGGDVVVHFPDLRVVHAGDLLHEVSPFIDYENGGGSALWVGTLNRLLELDFDTIIIGHGAPMGREEVVAFRSQMETVRARMRDMISAGALRRDVGSGIVSTDLSWTHWRSGGFFRSLGGLYEEIAAELRASGIPPRF